MSCAVPKWPRGSVTVADTGRGGSGATTTTLPLRALRRARHLAFAALGRTSFGTVTSVATDEPMVALTFDDGPDPRWTPAVLDVLNDHGAKATFFVIGENVVKHPDVMQRIHDEGHALGNHSQHHPSFPFITASERRRELRACAVALGPYPQARRLFRPPHLDQSVASRYDTWRLGYDVVACNRHARDWEERSSKEMERDLNEALGAGDIVMLHDALFDRKDRSRAPMIAALDAMLRRQAGRFLFVTVPTLLEAGRPHRTIWLKRPRDRRPVGHDAVSK